MLSIPHYLLLLWLGCWGTVSGAQEMPVQVIKATESHTVFLPCSFDPALASFYLDVTWFGPSGKQLVHTHVLYHHSGIRLGDGWGLLLYNISRLDDVWFTCKWNGISGTNYTLTNRIDEDLKEDGFPGNETDGDDESENTEEEMKGNGEDSGSSDFPRDLSHPAQHPELFPCDAPIPNNWTRGSFSWVQHDSLAQETVLLDVMIWHSTHYKISMMDNTIFLILPSVTTNDTGNYTCQWKDYKHHFQLEVMAKSAHFESFWLLFGHQHWIIWTVALGYMVFCLSSLFCFLWVRHSICSRKQQMTVRSPARRYFCAKRNKAHVSNGTVVSLANEDAMQMDAFSYENILPNTAPARNGRRLLQKGKILPNTINMEDDEEYECPDSETELKSDDDDNYENTQEEVKQEQMVPKDASPYENSNSKAKSGSHSWGSAGAYYVNKSPEAPKIVSQDPLEADGENYENLEEESPMSPGASRLIAGLRLHLAMDPPVDKQDGISENSTGSQSYEEMNGSLSPTAIKPFHLHPNTSNEEDADSYENMESPNSFSSRNEGNLDLRGEGVAFGSPWQHQSAHFSVDLRGGRLCSD